jgi:uncharacterized protein
LSTVSWGPCCWSWAGNGLELAVAQADGVVNLAGEPIAERRWTPAHRELLLRSRVRSTELLVAAMARQQRPPAVLVNGSAVGYYGASLQAQFSESSPAGCRLVKLRIGIVLAADGGALGKMLPVFRMGFGGPVGTGRQWMSWIHRHDLCRLIATALEDGSYSGVYNAVRP